MVGLACQYMWLVFVPLKDFITAFCLSVESSHPFKSLAIESPKMTVTLSYFFTCWVFQWRWIIGFADFFLVWFFSWFDRFRWFYIIPSITIVFNIIILWYFLVSIGCSYILIICWVVEFLSDLFDTLKSLLLGARGFTVCSQFQIMSVWYKFWFYFRCVIR